VAFVDITQAVGKIWHLGLFFKIINIFSHQYCTKLESYLTEIHFEVKFKDETTTLRKTEAGVPEVESYDQAYTSSKQATSRRQATKQTPPSPMRQQSEPHMKIQR
jgi:hypothetical protein